MEQEIENQKNEKNLPFKYLALFLLCAVSISLVIIVFSILTLDFVIKYRYPIMFLFCLTSFMLLLIGIIYLRKGKLRIYKLILVTYFTAIFFLIILWIAESLDLILILRTPDLLERYLAQWGALIPIVYIVLQIIQVLFLPIPSVFSILTGLRIFGLFQTVIYSFIGIFAGSIFAFLVGRKWGNQGVSWLIGEDALNEWQKRLHGKDTFVLALMLLLPFFPDDLLCFVAGVTSIRTLTFAIVMAITRVISILGTCLSFEFIPFNSVGGILTWVGIFAFLAFLFFLLYKNLERLNSFIRKRRKK